MARRFFYRAGKGAFFIVIYEYALDPAVISSWDKFRYFIEKFGYDQGRLIARFPDRKWCAKVLEACDDCGPIQLASITEKLNSIEQPRFFPSARIYNNQATWMDNAEQQHSVQAFQAIITQSKKAGIEKILLADEVTEDSQYFAVCREQTINRTAAEMLKCVEPLLRASSEIIFVDPHFKPENLGFRKPLELFLKAASAHGPELSRIEYHLGSDSRKGSFEYFNNLCQQKLSRLLPRCTELRLVRWQQRDGGAKMHARYVLTEFGGVRFDYGLDEGDHGETTDVVLLDRCRHKELWQSFKADEKVRNGEDGHLPFKYTDEVTV